jgi:hypothetical protein
MTRWVDPDGHKNSPSSNPSPSISVPASARSLHSWRSGDAALQVRLRNSPVTESSAARSPVNGCERTALLKELQASEVASGTPCPRDQAATLGTMICPAPEALGRDNSRVRPWRGSFAAGVLPSIRLQLWISARLPPAVFLCFIFSNHLVTCHY